jgi:transcriptional regulator
MYVPSHFRQSDNAELHALMRAQPLATLVTQSADGPVANHIPLLLDVEAGRCVLSGHLPRSNPAWKDQPPDAPVLALFHGPQAYVSPTWYAAKADGGRVVPTWNYTAVHARGRLRVVDDAAWLRAHLEAITDSQESRFGHPWKVSDAPADFTERLVQALVGIEIEITGLEGKWKIGQNRSAEDRAGVAAGLRSLGEAAGADRIAALMAAIDR